MRGTQAVELVRVRCQEEVGRGAAENLVGELIRTSEQRSHAHRRLIEGIVRQQLLNDLIQTDGGSHMHGRGIGGLYEPRQDGCCCLIQLFLNFPEDSNSSSAWRSQLCTAAVAASRSRNDEWLPGRIVDTLHQKPRATVRHPHLPGGFTDAVPALNPLKQFEPPFAE